MEPPKMIDCVLTEHEIDALLTHNTVLANRQVVERLKTSTGKAAFTLGLENRLIDRLNTALHCHLPYSRAVPFTWIKGDTPSHADTDSNGQRFKSHLLYLTDNTGAFCIDGHEFPIRKGCGFVFDHGVLHNTKNTGNALKLLVGPFNVEGIAVGVPAQGLLSSIVTTPLYTLEPPFDPAIRNYILTVRNNISSIAMQCTTSSPTSYLKGKNLCTDSNEYTFNYTLIVGLNTVVISVYDDVIDGTCEEPNSVYTIYITRNPPPPRPLYMGNMGSLFTDNALVYYKSHSLSSGGGGSGVRNCHAKQNRT